MTASLIHGVQASLQPGASDSGFCGEWKCAVLHVANSLW